MTATQPGKLFIIAAPSGTGKTSLVNALVRQCSNLVVSVSHTTRGAREGEVSGEHYYFIDRPTFESMMTEDAFLETAVVYDNLYGTSRAWVEEQLAKGVNVILEIDWQGAQQICSKFSEAMSVFILPPSREALEERLRSRQKDSEEVIQRRLQMVKDEVSHYPEFDYVMVNDEFDEALNTLKQIINGELQPAHHVKEDSELIRGLLG